MRICLDGRVIGGPLSGIPRLTASLITRLIEFGTEHEFIVLMRAKAPDEYLRPRKNALVHRINVPPYSLKEQFCVPLLLQDMKCDLYHSFTYAAPVFQVCRTIIAIHDLIPLEFPKYVGAVRRMYVKHVTRAAARRCWRVMTISNYSKWNICAYFGIPPEKVTVIPPAGAQHFARDEMLSRRAANATERYILNVSNKWPHKNTAAAVRVLKRIENECEHKLVIVGEQNRQVVRLISELGLQDRIVLKGNIPDEELIKLYHGADVFLFPSLSEGFGMPPLEAMACGVPTISSYAGSLAEVLDDGAVLVCPYDIEHMAEAILKVINDREFREHLIEKGLERAKMFNWDDSARKVLAMYKEAADE